MALTDLTRISTAGIATGSTIDSPILRKDVDFRGDQVGVGSALFDSSERRLDFKDNVKLRFGDSGDLSIYHDGSDSRISNGGGLTYILGDVIRFRNHGDSGTVLNAALAGVDLYASSAVKLSTNASGVNVTGVLTATSFSGKSVGDITGNVYAASGISTVYNLRVSNDLTVEGTTTTLDTNLIGVDRIEVGANSNSIVGVAITQSGTADIINLFDGTTEVLTVTDGGKVGIAITSPTEKLHVTGNIKATGTVTGSSFVGALPISNDSNDRVLTTSGSGVINAEANLTMTGNILTFNTTANTHRIQNVATGNHPTILEFDSNRSYAGDLLTIIDFQWDGDKVADILAVAGQDVSNKDDGHLVFRTSASQGAISEALRITSAGLVGIGVTNPEIYSNLAYNLVLRTTGNTGMTIRSGSSNKGGILFASADNNTSNEGIFQYDHSAKAFEFNNYGGGAEKFVYKIQGTEKMRIDASGNVGIKTVAPQGTLDVWGSISITNTGTAIQFSDPTTKAEYHMFEFTTDKDLRYKTYNGSSWGARAKVNKEGAFYVGTENWPTGSINAVEDRVMIGGGGDLTIWNEASASAGNVAKVRIGAKEGGDATKIGFSELRGGIVNTSDQSGFFKMQVSDASGSGQTRFYTDESYMRYGTSSHSQYTGYAHQMSSTSANGDVLSLETPSNNAGADIALGFWARNSNSALIQMGKINFDAETTTANSTQKGAMYTYVNSAGSLKLRHQISSTGSPGWFSDSTGMLTFKTDSGTTADNAGSGFYNVASSTQASRRALAWFDADGGGTFAGSDYGMIEKQGGGPLKIYNYADTTGIWFYCNGNNVRATLDSDGNFQTRGYGAVKNVWNMMNIDPAGTGFNGISDNNDGGGTSWEVQNGTTIRLYNTSGGHSGQWNQEVHLEENGYYYWRASYRVTTTCGAIHPSTPTSNYKYPIQVDFRMGASGDAASCQVSLYQRFATTGTCNGNQVGTGSLEHGTMVSLVGTVKYLPAGTYQPMYFTSGYSGVRELNVYKLELVQCGTPNPT